MYLCQILKKKHWLVTPQLDHLNSLYRMPVVAHLESSVGHIHVHHEPRPVPVRPPDHPHFLDRDSLRLWEEEVHEDGHDQDEEGEEEEEAELEVAEHRQEHLGDREREQHVDGDVDALGGRSDLQGEDLTGHEPPERPPWPCKARYIDAYE